MGLTSVEGSFYFHIDTIKAQLKDRKNSHAMLVDGMSKLTAHKVKTCQSSVFQVSGHKWKLIIHPAGKDGTKDYLSFYLRIKDKKSLSPHWIVTCNLKLSVVAQTGPNRCHSTEWTSVVYNAKQVMHGNESFMSHKVLKESCLVDDKAVFCAEVTNVTSTCAATYLPRTIGTAERLKLTEVARNKSRFTWKITQFSSFDGVRHTSYEFTVGPRRWKLVMYPKGNGLGKGNSLSLYLNASDFVTSGPKAKTLAVHKMRVLDQLHRKHHEIDNGDLWFHYDLSSRTVAWGQAKFLPLEKLNDPSAGLLVNDEIYISVDFLLVSTTEYL